MFITPEMGMEAISYLFDDSILADIDQFSDLADRPITKDGWSKTKRRALRIWIWIKRKIR